MGYTHYWTQHKPFTDVQWNDLMILTRALIDKTDATIVNGMAEPGTEPRIDDDTIAFNGVDDGVNDLGHETFSLAKDGSGFAFCKTAAKPYDDVVVAILLFIRYQDPDSTILEISSDGNIFDGGADGERGLALLDRWQGGSFEAYLSN